MSAARDEVVEFLTTQVASAFSDRGRQVDLTQESLNFMDAGLDSLAFLRLIGELEMQFGIEFDLGDADPEQMVTIGGLADLAVQAATKGR